MNGVDTAASESENTDGRRGGTRGRKGRGRHATPPGGVPVVTREAPRAPGGRGNFLRPRTFRARLVNLLIISLAAVIGLAGIQMNAEVDDWQRARDTAESVKTAQDVQKLIHQLQIERDSTASFMGGNEQFTAVKLGQTQAATDELASPVRHRSRSGNAEFKKAVQTYDDTVVKLREQAKTTEVKGDYKAQAEIFNNFTNTLLGLQKLDYEVPGEKDRQITNGLRAMRALAGYKEILAEGRGNTSAVLLAQKFTPEQYQGIAALRGAQGAKQSDFLRAATPQQAATFAKLGDTKGGKTAVEIEKQIMPFPDGRKLPKIDVMVWWDALSEVLNTVNALEVSIAKEIADRADEMESKALTNLFIYAAFLLLLILGEVALVVAGVRAISRPLAALAREAEEVATKRLPEVVARMQAGDADPQRPAPITVPGRAGSEIATVADALTKVQDAAVELAARQAAMRRNTTDSLVNLARRNQNLVRRQLGFITKLEHEEADPTALANLFELDHLATRMRRNAESLLVLVGEPGPRPRTAPLPVADVVRAALSEVEDYRRVSLRRMDDIAVTGGAATEIAHMLAELVENALSFSPPDVEVEVYGRRVGEDYLIAVIDHGVGMSPDQMATANMRLRGGEDFLDAPSRSLGHYVVGRLASRLGADIQMDNSPVTGVTARVVLPAAILVDPNRGTGQQHKDLAGPARRQPAADAALGRAPQAASLPRGASADRPGLTARRNPPATPVEGMAPAGVSDEQRRRQDQLQFEQRQRERARAEQEHSSQARVREEQERQEATRIAQQQYELEQQQAQERQAAQQAQYIQAQQEQARMEQEQRVRQEQARLREEQEQARRGAELRQTRQAPPVPDEGPVAPAAWTPHAGSAPVAPAYGQPDSGPFESVLPQQPSAPSAPSAPSVPSLYEPDRYTGNPLAYPAEAAPMPMPTQAPAPAPSPLPVEQPGDNPGRRQRRINQAEPQEPAPDPYVGASFDASFEASASAANGSGDDQSDLSDQAAARTRNGLAKRPPRRRDTSARPPARPVPTAGPGQSGVPERSPDELRSTLSAFRGGFTRGRSETTDSPVEPGEQPQASRFTLPEENA